MNIESIKRRVVALQGDEAAKPYPCCALQLITYQRDEEGECQPIEGCEPKYCEHPEQCRSAGGQQTLLWLPVKNPLPE